MMLQRNALYESSDEYFSLSGSAVMKLTTPAASAVCRAAAGNGLVIVRIEGGIWHRPGFEARIDCIWDGADPPIDQQQCRANNAHAAEFVESASSVNDAFVITTASVSGYAHKS